MSWNGNEWWSKNDWHTTQPAASDSREAWTAADQLRRNQIRQEEFKREKAAWSEAQAEKEPLMSLPAVDWATQPRKPFRREFSPYGCVDPVHARSVRSTIGVTVEQDPSGEEATPMPIHQFHEVSVLPHWLAKALADNKWISPTAIQAQALPIAVAGKDLIGIAQTGSGKTAAFLLPAMVQIEAQMPLTRVEPGPIMLCLAPTRELAVQINDEAYKLTKHSWESASHPDGIRSAVVYGGGDKRAQLATCSQEGSHILVATPGRLIDFLSECKLSLHRVTYFVLDEADRMLDMGFAGDVRTIASQVRPERQAMFFSATWSAAVQKLARDFCSQDPVRIRAGLNKGSDAAAADEDDEVLSAREGITQQVIILDGYSDWEKKEDEKKRLLDTHIRNALSASWQNKVLVFVNEKGLADELVSRLSNEFKADAIHGGRKQSHRLWVLDEFREGRVRLLVATDVVGRGIDIPNVSHVVVYDMGSIEGYIHRIGRTARGKEATGHALVFFEYYWKFPENAKKLAEVLQKSNQYVPPDLYRIAQEVVDRKRDICDEYGKKIAVGDTCADWAKKKQRRW